MASIIQLAGEGAGYDISDMEPHQESHGLGFSAVLRSKTTVFTIYRNHSFLFQNKVLLDKNASQHIEIMVFSIQKNVFLVPHAYLKEAG